MAEDLFKNVTAPEKSEPSGNPAVPGKQPNQPKEAPDANQTGSGPSNVSPPAKTEEGKGDPAQTTQDPEDGKKPDVSSLGSDDKDADLDMPSELDMLKKRATLMGLSYSNIIGVDALKEKIKAAIEGQAPKEEPKEEPKPAVNALTGEVPKKKTLRQHLYDEKMKLVRVRITNLDPKKNALRGEIITVANEYIGTVRKYVPFGEFTENGYHIPQCILDFLKDRQFLSIRTRKGPRGETIVEQGYAREFGIEILPPLSADELAKLAAAQTAGGNLND